MDSSGHALLIERAALEEGIRRLRKTGKSSSSAVSLQYDDDLLAISWAGFSELVPARGEWPGEVHVPAGWVRALAKALPAGDPFHLRVADGRVFAESISCPVVDPAAEWEVISPEERSRRISAATTSLERFLINNEDIEYLIDRATLEGSHCYHPDEDRLVRKVAEAWAVLAVFGVKAEDIYRHVQQQIRQAWQSGRRKL